MIVHDTVFVLGAGASAEYGFPTGEKLKENVENELMSVKKHLQALRRCETQNLYPASKLAQDLMKLKFSDDGENSQGIKLHHLNIFYEGLKTTARYSIDEYLQDNRENKSLRNIGKAAIAASLIVFEKSDLIDNYRGTTNHSYRVIFNEMGNTFAEFKNSPVHFVTFNYDRSLEYFMYHMLKDTYPEVHDELAAESVNELDIVHVHGQLGELAFGKAPPTQSGAYYNLIRQQQRSFTAHRQGGNIPKDSIKMCVESMKIVDEELDQAPEFEHARELIENARVLVFLGFGFNSVNLKRLEVNQRFKGKRILGTAYEVKQGLHRTISNMFEMREMDIGTRESKNDSIILGGEKETALEAV